MFACLKAAAWAKRNRAVNELRVDYGERRKGERENVVNSQLSTKM